MNQVSIIFREPLLLFSPIERFLVRLFGYVTYGVCIAMVPIFLFSDVGRLRSVGVLLALFLGDRLLHIGHAEKTFSYIRGKTVNVADYVSPPVLVVLEYALSRGTMLSSHIFLYVLERLVLRSEVTNILVRLDVTPQALLARIDAYVREHPTPPLASVDAIHQLETLIFAAFQLAQSSEESEITTRDLFAALGKIGDSGIEYIFDLFRIAPEDLEHAMLFSIAERKVGGLRAMPATLTGIVMRNAHRYRDRRVNRSWTARPTPTLDEFGDDFTELARAERVGLLIGHASEYQRLIDTLIRPSRANALLVGEPGVGKETIITHLAFEILHDHVPGVLFDKRLVSLQLSNLVAGADMATLRFRAQRIVDELTRAGNVILYIPDFHQLFRTSGPESLSVADIFLPMIKQDAFRVVATTYPKEYKEYLAPQNDVLEAFESIDVPPINEDDALHVLVYQSIILEYQYRLTISFSAVKQAVMLAHRYFATTPLPSSAVTLLKEALARASTTGKKCLVADDVTTIAEQKTNIPLRTVGATEAQTLLNLEARVHERLIDQDEAVTAVASALREYRSGLSRKGGPIATFLFVGPTGVGKTELSKILAKLQFASSDNWLRFDMSAYQSKESFVRFIGSPDGKIVGELTDAVSKRPYSLILLDEFEKAFPDILNLFLQVFDDGRLVDGQGRVVDFQNTIIIATSNAHSEFIKSSLEAGRVIADITVELKKKLSEYFRPELLNRFSSIIVFRTLLPEHIRQVAILQLKDLSSAIADAQGITVELSDAAITEIARLGFDPVFGARPLRGVISKYLRSVFAEKILRGEFHRGQHIVVDFVHEQFIF